MTGRGLLQISLAALTLWIGVHRGLAELEVFEPDPRFEPTALIFAGGLVFTETISGFVGDRRGRSWHLKKKRARKAVLACLSTIATSEGLDVTEIGGSVFLVRRRHWWVRVPELRRVIRYRLRDAPQQSDVVWSSGKGVIGRAWLERRAIHENLRTVSERYGGASISPEQFARVGPGARGAFTLAEFQSVVGKYAEVLGTPIWKNDQVIGVLSIDVPLSADHPSSGTCLDSKAAKEVAATCADTLADLF